MRIWSVHPRYLDAKGLVALWREALLAQAVLQGKTTGYKNHPQLLRFHMHDKPIAAIGLYLRHVFDEAVVRGYCFDERKIVQKSADDRMTIPVTRGQLSYELQHLLQKLSIRDKDRYMRYKDKSIVESHPLFSVINGPIAQWEKQQ